MTGATIRKVTKKSASRINALRHGLTGQVVLMPGEDLASFQRLSQAYHDEFQPATRKEKELTDILVEIRWRLCRVAVGEINLAALTGFVDAPEVKTTDESVAYALATAAMVRDRATALTNISLYEQRLVRQFKDTRNQLEAAIWTRERAARDRKRKEREATEEAAA